VTLDDNIFKTLVTFCYR